MFIQRHLHLLPVPFVNEIVLYQAHPASGLRRLAGHAGEKTAAAPYWAYCWAGGLALARYLLDHPSFVAGQRVLDLGSGSGLVAIAALKAGAAAVIAADIDPNAAAAISLNAEANGAAPTVCCEDLLDAPPPPVDMVVVGDLYYDRLVAMRLTAFLDRCLQAGVQVLIGDPYRAHLPCDRLRLVAEYAVPDFGSGLAARSTLSGIFRFEPEARRVPGRPARRVGHTGEPEGYLPAAISRIPDQSAGK